MKKTIFLSLCSLITILPLHAQMSTQRADELYLLMSYYQAASEYERLLETQYDTPALRIRLANSYYKIGDFNKALGYYNYVDVANYDKEDLFNYIQTAKMNEDYSKADLLMNFFCQEFEDPRCSNNSSIAQQLETLKNTVYFTVKESNLNTEFNDIGVYPASKEEIYIISDRQSASMSQYNGKGFFDIFYAQKLGKDSYSEPQKITGDINSKLNEGPLCTAAGGKRIYFTRNNKNTVKDIHHLSIYMAEINHKGEWGNIRGLSINSDTYSTGHPVLSADGKKMIFSSTRNGGYGGSDLYIADVLEDGDVNNVTNLGSLINTPRNESFPWIDPNGNLYFASDGHPGFGGLDIFMAKMNGINATEIINCGANINSPQDDFALTLFDDGKTGYMASNRKKDGNEQYRDNLYNVKLIKEITEQMVLFEDKITAQTVDENLEEIRIEIRDPQTDEIYSTTTDKDGNYALYIPKRMLKDIQKTSETAHNKDNSQEKNGLVEPNKNHVNPNNATNKQDAGELVGLDQNETSSDENVAEQYTVRVQKPGYETKEIPLEQRVKSANKRIPMSLDKLEVGNVLNTTVVYFDLDRYTITNQAKKELDIIVGMLNDNPNMVLEIFSYTDCRASLMYNLTLSNNRAKATIEYVQARISNPSRIYGKGYGEINPIVDCMCRAEKPIDCSEEEHRLNRRTEFKIIKL